MQKFFILARNDVRIPAGIVGLLLSVWAFISNDTINSDGILYVRVAELLSQGDRAAAYELYPWLFYSWLIALTGNITQLGLENSAHLLNAVLDLLGVAAFITIVRDLGADRKTLLLSAFVILFHPYLNESRPEIIRGHGYWALYLVSLLAMVRFYQAPTRALALGWGTAICTATLFRIEGTAFLALLPLVVLLNRQYALSRRLVHLLMANIVPLTLLAGVALWLVFSGTSAGGDTGRLFEPVSRLQDFWRELHSGLEIKAGVMRDHLLNRWSDEYAMPAVLSIVLLILVHRILLALTPLYTILPVFRNFRARFNPPADLKYILIWAGLINLLVLFIFLLPRLFLSGRFVYPFVLTVLLVIPFTLASAHDQWLANRGKGGLQAWGFRLMAVLLIFMTLDGLITTKSRAYMRNAGEWMSTHIPAESRIYVNNQKLNFFAGRPVDFDSASRWQISEDIVRTVAWRDYDYLVLWAPKFDSAGLLQLKALVAIKQEKLFTSPDGKKVLIFRVLNSTNSPP